MKFEFWYSVINGGDGSAYPKFFTSEMAAKIHQDVLVNGYEGWGEQCVGALRVKSDSPVFPEGISTTQDLIDELQENLDDNWAGYSEDDLQGAIDQLKGIK